MSGILFRVHISAGEPIDVSAGSSAEARTIVQKRLPDVLITKIKVVKGE